MSQEISCMKNFNVFLIFHNFSQFSVFSVTFSTPVGVIYSIPQKIPLKWYITSGPMVHHSHFRKKLAFPLGSKGLRKDMQFNSKPVLSWCGTNYSFSAVTEMNFLKHNADSHILWLFSLKITGISINCLKSKV